MYRPLRQNLYLHLGFGLLQQCAYCTYTGRGRHTLAQTSGRAKQGRVNALFTNSLTLAIGEHTLETAHFHSFMLWGSNRHESQIESFREIKKCRY